MSDILTMRRKTVASPLGSDPATVWQVNGAVTVGVAATAIPAVAGAARKVLIIYNNGGNVIYLGDVGVTTANGIPLQPGGYFVADINNQILIYGISAVAGNNVRWMELG